MRKVSRDAKPHPLNDFCRLLLADARWVEQVVWIAGFLKRPQEVLCLPTG